MSAEKWSNPSGRPFPAALADHVAMILSAELPPIVTAGDPVLRRPAVDFDGQLDHDTLHRLVTVMRHVMHEAPGVGLAAPQIGIPLRIAVLEDPGVRDPEVAEARSRSPLPFTVMINPRYEAVGDRRDAFYEGCLSVPGYQAVVERHHSILATYIQPDGSPVTTGFDGWAARIVQHETDHLDGRLYLDRSILRSLTSDAEHRRWMQPTIEKARRELDF